MQYIHRVGRLMRHVLVSGREKRREVWCRCWLSIFFFTSSRHFRGLMALGNLVAKNYIYSFFFKMVDLVIPLLTTPYLARVLGKTGVGIYAYTYSVITFFVLLASAGINIYGQREIAYVQKDPVCRTRLFWQVFALRLSLLLITGCVYWAWFGMGGEYAPLYRILFINLVANAIDISWFFQGLEDFQKTAVRNIAVRLAGAALIFLFVRDGDDLLTYALLVGLSALLGNLSLWLYLPRFLEHINPQWRQAAKHVRPIAALFIPQLAIEIYTVLDKTMLGALGASMAEVAYYEQSQKVVRIGLRFITALGSVMLSRVSNAYAEEGDTGLRGNVSLSFRFTFFLGIPVMLGVLGTAQSLVPWFFGAGYASVSPLIMMVSPIVMCIGVSNILGMQYLIPTRQQRIYSLSVIGGSLVNCVLNWLLIPKWNAVGASVASVCAESFVVFVQILATRGKLPYFSYLKESWKSWISGFIMLFLILVIGHLLSPSPYCTAIQVMAGAVVYYGLLLLFKDPFAIRTLQAAAPLIRMKH